MTSDGIDDVDSTVETDESDDESQSKNGQEVNKFYSTTGN